MKKPVVVGDKPNAPPPPPKEDAVLGTLKGHELLNFREASVAERRAQRELQKAQLRSQEVIDGIRGAPSGYPVEKGYGDRRRHGRDQGEGVSDSKNPEIPFTVRDSNRIAECRTDIKMLKWINGAVLALAVALLSFLAMRG